MGYSAVTKVRSPGDAAISMIQSKYREYHPLLALADMAHRADVIADPRLEFEIHKTILPFVMPKLASVEVKPAVEDDRRVIVSLFEARHLEDGRTVEVEVPLITEVGDLVQIDD